MFPSRLIGLSGFLIALAGIPSASAQQNLPPLLTPAPPIITPPPPVAPAPVPSVVTPLPQPEMGVPRNLNNGPLFGSSGGTVRSIYRGSERYGAPNKKRGKKHRRPRVSAY